MSKLRARYQNQVVDRDLWEASVAVYLESCEDYDAPHIRAAFDIAWKQYPQWMPSCGQLVEIIEGQGIKAAQAWPEVMQLASRSSGDHSDPIAKEAIRLMGGGRRLGCMKTSELEVWGRKEFEVIYAEVSKRVSCTAAIKALPTVDQLDPKVKDVIAALAGKHWTVNDGGTTHGSQS